MAIDGVDGAGKTVFADELASVLGATARVRADDHLNPAHVRHARGRDSPLGFFLDTYDLGALRAAILAAPPPAIVDGLFLHRDELRDLWDYSVFLSVPPEVSVARCFARDGPVRPDAGDRYAGGQRIYFARCAPWTRATRVVDNTDLTSPRLAGGG